MLLIHKINPKSFLSNFWGSLHSCRSFSFPASTLYTSGVPDKVCDFVGCSYTIHSTPHYTTLPNTTPYYPTLHHTTPHYTTPHYTILPNTTPYYPTLPNTTPYYPTLHHTTPHYTILPNTTPYYPTLHHTTPHYISYIKKRVQPIKHIGRSYLPCTVLPCSHTAA